MRRFEGSSAHAQLCVSALTFELGLGRFSIGTGLLHTGSPSFCLQYQTCPVALLMYITYCGASKPSSSICTTLFSINHVSFGKETSCSIGGVSHVFPPSRESIVPQYTLSRLSSALPGGLLYTFFSKDAFSAIG